MMEAEEECDEIGDCGEEVVVFHVERYHREGSHEFKEERDFRTVIERENQREERKENRLFMHYT